jgi:hypothetical protein
MSFSFLVFLAFLWALFLTYSSSDGCIYPWMGMVTPLKKKMRFLQSDNKSKAEILNEQFQSVFTKENLDIFLVFFAFL